MFSILKLPARLISVGVLALVLPLAVLAFATAPAKAATDGGAGASPWQQTEQTALRLIAATETTGDARILKFGLHFKLKPAGRSIGVRPATPGFRQCPTGARRRT